MLSDQLHKNSLYENETFPFVMFTINRRLCTPPGPGYHYLHWHEALQFTIVTKGTVSMQVNGENYDLETGGAIFINGGLLHMTNQISEDGEYISFNFPAKLLSFFYGSQLELDYVLPFTSNYSFPFLLLNPSIPWQSQIIDDLSSLRSLCEASNYYGKNYEIVIRLTQIWIQLITNIHDSINKTSKTFIRKQEKLQTMLAFIHSNYQNDICLTDIAETAHISTGECCRCFKNTLHITPYEYLINFRINKSADLLKETNHSIADIAGMVGFNDSSHFIQLFKKKMQVTPKEYKKELT